MALTDNERLQEVALMAGDKVASVGTKWWYALVVTIVAAVPGYYLLKLGLSQIFVSSYDSPQVIYANEPRQPLEVTEKGVFALGNNGYSGYIKISNIEHSWGVARQGYNVELKTLGGTLITRISGSAFILPASEKLIVFSRFTSEAKPGQILVTLEPTQFIRKSDIEFNYSLERITRSNTSLGLVVSAGIKNLTPFTITTIHLPAVIYNNRNEIIAVTFTQINDVLAGETRTFQYSPIAVNGADRIEIHPEINIFDREVFDITPGVDPGR